MAKYIARVTVSYTIINEDVKGTEIGQVSYYYEKTFYRQPKKRALQNFSKRAQKHARSNIKRYNKRVSRVQLKNERTSREAPRQVLKGFTKTRYRAVRRQGKKAYWIRGDSKKWLKIK